MPGGGSGAGDGGMERQVCVSSLRVLGKWLLPHTLSLLYFFFRENFPALALSRSLLEAAC